MDRIYYIKQQRDPNFNGGMIFEVIFKKESIRLVRGQPSRTRGIDNLESFLIQERNYHTPAFIKVIYE